MENNTWGKRRHYTLYFTALSHFERWLNIPFTDERYEYQLRVASRCSNSRWRSESLECQEKKMVWLKHFWCPTTRLQLYDLMGHFSVCISASCNAADGMNQKVLQPQLASPDSGVLTQWKHSNFHFYFKHSIRVTSRPMLLHRGVYVIV